MFDEYARQLIDQLPSLPELAPIECRRALSRAYLMIVDSRVRTSGGSEVDADEVTLRDTLRRMANALESIAVFDPLGGVDRLGKARDASAFVAAEALSLMHELMSSVPAAALLGDPFDDGATYTLVESALLYI